MAKPQGHCIFCGGPGLSKEHIFGDWLKAIFPRAPETTHTLGTITWPHGESAPTPPIVARKVRPGHSGTRTARVVCKKCNETWMSLLESNAIPILTPLISGDRLTINLDSQKTIATWAAKGAITGSYLSIRDVVIHQSDRTYLMETISPPKGWFVWIAPFRGVFWRELAMYQNIVALDVPSVDENGYIPHNLMLTFMGIGNLFILVINSSWNRMWPILDQLGPLGGARIWPSRSEIHWPTPYVLTDAEAEYFTEYLTNVVSKHPV